MKNKIIAISIAAAIALVAATITTVQMQQVAFADRNAILKHGSICPPGHECSCNAASGVFHDTDPATGQTFNINTGCTEDTGGVGGSSSDDKGSSSDDQ